jgi:hypothetical protein
MVQSLLCKKINHCNESLKDKQKYEVAFESETCSADA